MTRDDDLNESWGDLRAQRAGSVEDAEWFAELTPEEQFEEPADENPFPSLFGSLLPWQRFVLALLLLLDIAFIGLLFMLMLGVMELR
ncbi:MAG: hypothetical protein ACLFU8_12215 [Anaerolineales bacterium]